MPLKKFATTFFTRRENFPGDLVTYPDDKVIRAQWPMSRSRKSPTFRALAWRQREPKKGEKRAKDNNVGESRGGAHLSRDALRVGPSYRYVGQRTSARAMRCDARTVTGTAPTRQWDDSTIDGDNAAVCRAMINYCWALQGMRVASWGRITITRHWEIDAKILTAAWKEYVLEKVLALDLTSDLT